MIYEFPEQSSPIGQGDIFFGIPTPDLTDDEIPVIDDEGAARAMSWEAFASAGEQVSAIVSVRPTIAIVGTQECDALRAPNITLFEVRPFREVARKSKDTNKPSKWVPIITQHARINQKWFYLPADERIGFTEKMGADFLTPIRVPRLLLERLLSFRKGRLNEVAKQHFRERLAEFFRRYAYDEWYPLTREELAEYHKNHPDAEPFPWQRENPSSDDENVAPIEVLKQDNEKGFLDFLVDGEVAGEELADIISIIDTERRSLETKVSQQIPPIIQLKNNPAEAKASDFQRIALLIASDIDLFSEHIEGVSPKLAKITQILEESYYALVLGAGTEHFAEMVNLRSSLSQLPDAIRLMQKSLIEFRDETLWLRDQNINKELKTATGRQAQALDHLITQMEQVESFALRVTFLIDEKIGGSAPSEDKAG
ncbi:MAG TPA: hypothetical protein VK422_12240 [Pyrinomonadaceae bacterium]|nr:hypothetical protein [Pyrinomonadaceae bacterium]